MNIVSPPFPPAHGQAPAAPSPVPPMLGAKWLAVQEVAALVAELAGIEADPQAQDGETFIERLALTKGWRRNLAENGIDDLVAVVEPGVAALLSLRARGIDARPPALALWQEIEDARATLLALVAPLDQN